MLAGAGAVTTVAILLAVALGGPAAAEPPVHLDIKIVDVADPPEDETDNGTAAWFAAPEEARNP